MRAGLSLLPFPVLRRLVGRLSANTDVDRPGSASNDDLAWAIETASRFVPRSTCLSRAMAAKLLFGIYGHSSLLKIGVLKGEDGRVLAHAWLESRGKVIVGGPDGEYTPLLTLE